MPLLSREKRPALEGLTKDEEKRRNALNDEVTKRCVGRPRGSQGVVIREILREKQAEEPQQFLWPLLLGWQLMGERQFVGAIDAFNEAVSRKNGEVRSHWGAGAAYTMAARAAQSLGAGVTDEMVPAGVPATTLYASAERCFDSGIGVTSDRDELEKLHQAVEDVRLAITRSATVS